MLLKQQLWKIDPKIFLLDHRSYNYTSKLSLHKSSFFHENLNNFLPNVFTFVIMLLFSIFAKLHLLKMVKNDWKRINIFLQQ